MSRAAAAARLLQERDPLDQTGILVAVGICTHLGCAPSEKLKLGGDSGMGGDWPGGFFCPCHGVRRSTLPHACYKGVPAPTNR